MTESNSTQLPFSNGLPQKIEVAGGKCLSASSGSKMVHTNADCSSHTAAQFACEAAGDGFVHINVVGGTNRLKAHAGYLKVASGIPTWEQLPFLLRIWLPKGLKARWSARTDNDQRFALEPAGDDRWYVRAVRLNQYIRTETWHDSVEVVEESPADAPDEEEHYKVQITSVPITADRYEEVRTRDLTPRYFLVDGDNKVQMDLSSRSDDNRMGVRFKKAKGVDAYKALKIKGLNGKTLVEMTGEETENTVLDRYKCGSEISIECYKTKEFWVVRKVHTEVRKTDELMGLNVLFTWMND